MRSTLRIALALLASLVLMPTVASGVTLTNPEGMVFAGQAACIQCHNKAGGGIDYNLTLHGRHMTPGLTVAPPAGWTQFAGSGSVAISGAPAPGSGLRWYSAGGVYPIAGLTWMTMFDYLGGSRWSEEEAPLMFFSGSPTTSTASPWNRVSGLGLTHTSPYYEYLANTTALSDSPVSSTCGYINCHVTGGTQPLAANQTTLTIPNPAVATQPTTQTPTQWARDPGFTTDDFHTTATASYQGLGVQCEKCHGSGISSAAIASQHWNTGTQLSHRLPTSTVNAKPLARTTNATLGRSDVCGVCHGLRSANPVAGALPYSMGYTPNLFVRNFVSVNATRGANAPYTYTPTAQEFAANPAIYSLYPNGNPKNGGHGGNQYWAWGASAHAVRVQTGANDPDNLPGAENTHFLLSGVTTLVECLRCHSGEGYLTTKVPQITDRTAVKSIWDGFVYNKTTAGFMGQECDVCHDPHPASSDADDVVRSADPAGMRSNFGRTTANASMCEDCHNWQVEVLANSLPLSDFSPQNLPGRVSHPQRELLHGVARGTAPVMWEVADMGEFMPGARCQDCHMPKTDTSAEYSSHRMMIQKPGDAAAWGATGQDSCTKCHEEAGPTIAAARATLQSRLDEWQAEAVAAGNVAKTELDAAKLRSEYVAGGAGAKELYGRAWLNWNSFVNDASSGAHNPPYVMAGLEASRIMALSVGGSFGQIFSSTTVSSGNVASIAGSIMFGNGAPAAGAKIALEQLSGSSWVQVGNTVVDPNGNYAFKVAPSVTTTYRVRWDRCSNNVSDIYSPTATIAVISSGPPVNRIGGANRYVVAVNLAEQLRDFRSGPFTDVVIASGEDRAMADPLGAAGLASAYGAPVLLSPAGYVNTSLINELKALRNENGGGIDIHVVGGTGSISTAVYSAIAATRGSGTIERINGVDRYDLAARMATRTKNVVEGNGGTIAGVLVVNIENSASFNDALAASSISAKSHLPLIGVRATSVPSYASNALAQFTSKPKYAVNAAYLSSGVRSATGCSATMANTTSRYVAAVDIAKFGSARGLVTYKNVGLANKLSDALPAGAFLGQIDGVLLYTPYSPLSTTTRNFVESIKADVSTGWVFGGTATISSSTAAAFKLALQ